MNAADSPNQRERQLPDLDTLDVQSLKALVLAKQAELDSRTTEIENLKLLILKLKRMHFGPRSEKYDRDIQQLELRLEDLEATRADGAGAGAPRRSQSADLRDLPRHGDSHLRGHRPEAEARELGARLHPYRAAELARDIDTPKTMGSTRTLALGNLVTRYETWIAKLKTTNPEAWVFPKRGDRNTPLWDSGVRQALKNAAEAENCDFEGFGPHSLRRASITLRQEVGASAIEASKVAGHSKVNMTGEYTIVQLKRQDELTRKMQDLRTGTTTDKEAAADKVVAEPAA